MAPTPSRPQRGRALYLSLSGRVAALNSGFWCVRRCAQQSTRAIAGLLLCPLPPAPPASRNGRQKAQTVKKGSRPGAFSRCGMGSNAKNSWFSGRGARKSLILEASTATNHPVIAISRGIFAISPISGLFSGVLFFSLSKLLKKKKKEYVEGQEIGQIAVPRVGRVLPRVAAAAYFLGHESDRGATGFSWQLMAEKHTSNQ
ncbi:Baseplate J family protein [Burkholderia stagnalis]|nr:Baseplate J family protein [Burkholderia stagnalis]RQQ65376.1 Baseplate J family protein [Burkholderia stagnalis]RQQ77593.1 Baseplate J family protein [Burkholderia stagnalis]RQQ86285.1 Baseplate J family protein [Burkholderia stagnalis]